MNRLEPEAEPAFAEPWQAQAFALAVHLRDTGAFTATEWANALGAQIHRVNAPGADLGYFAHWLAALERLALDGGLVGAEDLKARTLAWAEAYRTTPHGAPVELNRDPP